MRVFLDSIGCRLNQSEIEAIARRLMAAGHEIVQDPTRADKVVINTCAVTAGATRDTRKMARSIHRRNPAAEILLTGCHATIAPEELGALEVVSRIVPNDCKDDIAGLLDPDLESSTFDQEPILRDFLAGRHGNTRAFVKVQDGCDKRCTFCVTTVARGAGKSRPLEEVVTEITALARAGYQEAVLTGVHLGSYGHDLQRRHGLHDLIATILERTGIPRLRVSSLEPWDLAPEFFDLWQDSRLLPHLHLPLQAGCDHTLRRMARNTTRDQFRALAAAARERIPGLNLSTDVIVGFPGETDADFEESFEFVRQIEFCRLHVFTYSPRPATLAATMPDQIAGPVKKARCRRMIDLGKDLGRAFHETFIGRELSVLWETALGVDNGMTIWGGYTENYIRVTAHCAEDIFNRILATRLSGAGPDGCAGSIVGGAPAEE